VGRPPTRSRTNTIEMALPGVGKFDTSLSSIWRNLYRVEQCLIYVLRFAVSIPVFSLPFLVYLNLTLSYPLILILRPELSGFDPLSFLVASPRVLLSHFVSICRNRTCTCNFTHHFCRVKFQKGMGIRGASGGAASSMVRWGGYVSTRLSDLDIDVLSEVESGI
jgi:hypothetical protein